MGLFMDDIKNINSEISKINESVGVDNNEGEELIYRLEVNSKKKYTAVISVCLVIFIITIIWAVLGIAEDRDCMKVMVKRSSDGDISNYIESNNSMQAINSEEIINNKINELTNQYDQIKFDETQRNCISKCACDTLYSGSLYDIIEIKYVDKGDDSTDYYYNKIRARYSGKSIDAISIIIRDKQKELTDIHIKILEKVGFDQKQIDDMNSYISGKSNSVDGMRVEDKRMYFKENWNDDIDNLYIFFLEKSID